jgi:hypothetical protein
LLTAKWNTHKIIFGCGGNNLMGISSAKYHFFHANQKKRNYTFNLPFFSNGLVQKKKGIIFAGSKFRLLIEIMAR